MPHFKRFSPHWAVLLFCCSLNSISGPGGSTCSGEEPRKDRTVILVSVDGLAGFYFDDPKSQMPTLRRLAREGARAGSMVCSFPTVTWPNHTTLVTGVNPARHGVIGNSVLDRKSGEKIPFIPDPLLDKDQIVKVPTIYDVAHKAGLTTAGIVWPATRNARTLTWTVPDMAGDGWKKFGTPDWMAELTAAGFPLERHGDWCKEPSGGVQRDWLYVRMADQLLQKHSPNLLMIHLVETDHVEHKYGPRSPEAYWAVSYADDRLRDLVESIEKSPRKDQTTLIVCSDHGFFPIEREIRPNVLLRQHELLSADGTKVTKKVAYSLSEGGAASVYILDDARRAALTTQLKADYARIEGVDAVFGPEDFGKLGQPTLEQDPHAPDLWLIARSGYSFSETAKGDEIVGKRDTKGGAHGYQPSQPDLFGTFVAWGAGIKAGTKIDQIRNLDVAPTIGRLLSIDLPNVEGIPLTTLLAK